MSTIVLDRFGRIVIPKEMRDQHGWTAGTELIIDDHADAIHLRAAQTVASGRGLVVRDGGLVYDATWQTAQSSDLDPIRAVLEATRTERDQALGGSPT